jgi:hypothetical protein
MNALPGSGPDADRQKQREWADERSGLRHESFHGTSESGAWSDILLFSTRATSGSHQRDRKRLRDDRPDEDEGEQVRGQENIVRDEGNLCPLCDQSSSGWTHRRAQKHRGGEESEIPRPSNDLMSNYLVGFCEQLD